MKLAALQRRIKLMKVIANICLVPIGVGVSVSKYVAICERVFNKAGLSFHLHANRINVEGEWDDVFGAIKRCHEEVHAMNVVCIHTTIQLGTRTDRTQTMKDKVQSVQAKLTDDKK